MWRNVWRVKEKNERGDISLSKSLSLVGPPSLKRFKVVDSYDGTGRKSDKGDIGENRKERTKRPPERTSKPLVR